MNSLELEPAWWSRNTGDDCDEEDLLVDDFRIQQEQQAAVTARQTPVFTPAAGVTVPIPGSLLILACDALASTFLRRRFLQTASPAAAAVATLSMRPQPASARYTAASLHSITGCPSVLLCYNFADIAAAELHGWARCLLQQLRPAGGEGDGELRLVLLESQPLSAFVSASSSPPVPPVLRCIATTASLPLPTSLQALPPPNSVHSLSAALLAAAEIHRLPAVCLYSFTSPHYISESLNAFNALDSLLPAELKAAQSRTAVGAEGGRDWETEWGATRKAIEEKRRQLQKDNGGSVHAAAAQSWLLQPHSHDMFV